MRVSTTLLSLLLFVCSVLAGALGYEKKSDIAEFASAINGAGRLRYGKRSSWDYVDPQLYRQYLELSQPSPYVKRAPMTNKLVESLNGAERLRFGRK